MVYGIKLNFNQIQINQAGKYSCLISNHYGKLSKSINVKVGKYEINIISWYEINIISWYEVNRISWYEKNTVSWYEINAIS